MKAILLMLPLLGLVIVANSQAQDDGTEERKALQGTWVVVSAALNDKANGYKQGDKFTFSGDKVTIETKVKKRGPGGPGGPVIVKFDGSKSPKQIDFAERTPLKGIYKLEDNLLWICYGTKRPDEFKSSAGLLLILKREKQ